MQVNAGRSGCRLHGSSCCRLRSRRKKHRCFYKLDSKRELDLKERIFVAISYCPGNCPGAAIGAFSSSFAICKKRGMPDAPGQLILAISVLSIILTARSALLRLVISGEKLLSED